MICRPKLKLRFVRKPDSAEGEVASYRRWRSRCGRLRVTHARYRFGKIPDQYRAERFEDGCWDVISKHRKSGPAFRACERYAAQHAANAD